MTAKKTLKLGDRVKDKVSGYKGVIIGEHQWLYGCKRLTIQSEELKDGKPIDTICIDEPQAQLVKSGVVKSGDDTPVQQSRVRGGPRNSPSEKPRR
jgi:hypothetical protein